MGFTFLYFWAFIAVRLWGHHCNLLFPQEKCFRIPQNISNFVPCSLSWNQRTNSGQPLPGLMTSMEISTWFAPAHPWKFMSPHFLNRRGPLLSPVSLSSSDWLMSFSGAFDEQELCNFPSQTQLGVLYTVYIFVISVKVNVNTISMVSGNSLEDWYASVPTSTCSSCCSSCLDWKPFSFLHRKFGVG